jgi:pimeloyl-ACP methyl ester carboxylesterase
MAESTFSVAIYFVIAVSFWTLVVYVVDAIRRRDRRKNNDNNVRLDELEKKYIELLNDGSRPGAKVEIRSEVHHFRVSEHRVRVRALKTVQMVERVPTNEIILYVHGTSSSAAGFALAMRRIADRCPDVGVHAIDMPGFGRSDVLGDHGCKRSLHLSATDVLDQYVRVIDAYVKDVVGERVVLMGHSFGGFVCVHYASRYSHHVKKLVLINAAGLYPVIGEWGNYWALFFKALLPQSICAVISRMGLKNVVHRWIDRAIFRDAATATSDPKSTFAHYYFELLCDESVYAHIYVAKFIELGVTGSRWKDPVLGLLVEMLQDALFPTCMIHGAHDHLIPSHQGDALSRAFPDLRVEIIGEGGHSPYADTGIDEFCDVVVSFLRCPSPPPLPQKTKRTTRLRARDIDAMMLPFRASYFPKRTRDAITAQYEVMSCRVAARLLDDDELVHASRYGPKPVQVQREQERRHDDEH